MRTDSGTEALGIISYPPEYSTGMTNIGLWLSSRENLANLTCATVNITGFETARSDLALLASVVALDILLGKFFCCFVHLSMLSPRGGDPGHMWGIGLFRRIFGQNPHHGAPKFGKIRSNIPTLGK